MRVAALVACVLAGAGGATAAVLPAIEFTVDHRVVEYRDDATFMGRVPGARAGKLVVLEMKECGRPGWIELIQTRTAADGSWKATAPIATTSQVRARAAGELSDAVRIVARPGISLYQYGNQWTFSVSANQYFRGKRVRLERFERSTGRWVLAKTAPLRTAYGFSQGVTTLRVPRGTTMRAVFPRPNACYVTAVSRVVLSN